MSDHDASGLYDDQYELHSRPSTARRDNIRPRSDGSRSDHYEAQRGGTRQNKSVTGGLVQKKETSWFESGDDAGLSETAAPAPIERGGPSSRTRDDRLEHRPDQRKDLRALSSEPRFSSATGGSSQHNQEEDLDEIAAPPPVETLDDDDKARRGDYLEQRRGSEDDAAPPPFGPSRAQSRSLLDRSEQPRDQRPKYLLRVYTISYLVFFSFLGTLARLGLQWLTFYPGAPIITPVLWANIAGSLVMGFLSEDKRLFRNADSKMLSPFAEKRDAETEKKEHSKVKKTIPLYVGLATGFCGSFTSFSSFERDVFLALSNDLPAPIYHPVPAGTAYPSFTSTIPRNGGYSFMAVLAVIISTIGLSLAALFMGAHLALALGRFTPILPFHFTRRIIDPLFVFLAAGCWIGAILLSIFPPDRLGGPLERPPDACPCAREPQPDGPGGEAVEGSV